MDARHTNRLAREKSPYLLQHAHNPVDWFAWGNEAFAAARAADRPIFLSIGYSTCHWCHVMERESFEDETLAAFLREHFISIKVDREERPDVDKIYMTFVQATSGHGGWPLSVFLTPDLKPFYGGTYFPPDNRRGSASFRQILEQIVQVWRERRAEINASAGELHTRLERFTAREPKGEVALTRGVLQQALAAFKQAHDPVNGGFGGAPKFPQPAIPAFVLRAAKRFADYEAAGMVFQTCDQMAAGGIHDQLGGGFARYAVDAQWLVPHFEKMLYDNAQLAQLYLDAHLLACEDEFGRSGFTEPPPASRFSAVVRDILDYILRDMTHPEGGFYSAEDADSEGHEGKFYCWTQAELSRLLTPAEFVLAEKYFGVTPAGNFVDHSHPEPLAGQNVLSVVNSCADPEVLAVVKAKLLAARAQRVRPHLDDKILVSWNGLMLGSLARAALVLNEARYLQAAERNLAFIRAKLWVADEGGAKTAQDSGPARRTGTLYHRWRDGERDQVQLLEGYAFLLDGVIQLYEATLEPAHLDFAVALAETLLARFYDAALGGFWQSPAGQSDLILRVKDDYDGAEPSGNSVATLALLKLAAITGRADFEEAAAATLELSASRLQAQPGGQAYLLQALDFRLEEPLRVVLAGDRKSPVLHQLLRATHSVYQPNKVILGNAGLVEPFAATLRANGDATAYLCTGNACQPPTHDPAQLRQGLLGKQ
jgi:hypothetical protein